MDIRTEKQLEEIDYVLIERGIAWLTSKDEVSDAAGFEEFVEAFLQIAGLDWQNARHRAHMMKRATGYIEAILRRFEKNLPANELAELQKLCIQKFERRITDKFIEGTLKISLEKPSEEILDRREELRSKFKRTLTTNLSEPQEQAARGAVRLTKKEKLLQTEAILAIQFLTAEQATRALPKVKEFARKIDHKAWATISSKDPAQIRICADMNRSSAEEIELFATTAANQLHEKGFTKSGTSKNSKIGCLISHWSFAQSNPEVVEEKGDKK